MAKDLLVKEQTEKKAAPEKPEKKKETPMEFISSMAVVLVTGLFIITFNLQAFEIPSSSMERTLLIGDHVFVDRVTLAPKTSWMPLERYREIHRGDIVVFLSPETAGLYVVKRIIGVPGDRIHLRDGVVYVNGIEQKEPYVIHVQDNRDHSLDSRYWGFVPRENVIGRPLVIYWSMKQPEPSRAGAADDKLSSLVYRLTHLLENARWSRSLRVVR